MGGGGGRTAADGTLAKHPVRAIGERTFVLCRTAAQLSGCLYMAASQMETGRRLECQQWCCCLAAQVPGRWTNAWEAFVSPHTYAELVGEIHAYSTEFLLFCLLESGS